MLNTSSSSSSLALESQLQTSDTFTPSSDSSSPPPTTANNSQFSPPTTAPDPSHPMVTRNKDNTRKPKSFPNYVAYATYTDHEPKTFAQANTSPEWRDAMSV